MLELFTISAKSLCLLLSANPQELNSMEAAIRLELEKGNTTEELEAIRKAACLEKNLPEFTVSSTGRARRL